MAIAVGGEFVGALGGGIQGQRPVDGILYLKRHARIGAVHRAARRVDQVRRSKLPTGLKHVDKADQIGLGVNIRLFKRITHTGLRRQMNDLFEGVLREEGGQTFGIGDVQPVERETWQALEYGKARLLELDAVVIVEVVDTDDLHTEFAQTPGDMKPDEPCSTCHQYRHGGVARPRPMP